MRRQQGEDVVQADSQGWRKGRVCLAVHANLPAPPWAALAAPLLSYRMLSSSEVILDIPCFLSFLRNCVACSPLQCLLSTQLTKSLLLPQLPDPWALVLGMGTVLIRPQSKNHGILGVGRDC